MRACWPSVEFALNRCSADGRGHLHAKVNGHPIELNYLQRGEVLDFHHTGVDPALQVRGLAAKLVAHGLQWLTSADPRLEGALEYAPKHQAVIEQLGRIPLRNALLARSSSAAEADYLAQPGAGF